MANGPTCLYILLFHRPIPGTFQPLRRQLMELDAMIREIVMSFKPYRVVEGNYRIWLDKNENPYDLPMEIKEEIFEELKKLSFNRYPHITSMPLREAIGDVYGVPPGMVAVGNGADELISYLVRLFKGSYVVTTPPTFGMYSFHARLGGIPVVEVPLGEGFILDGDGVVKRAKNASAIFLCSPNNPTGNLQPEEEIVKVLETGKPVVLDEAYAEFSGKSLWKLVFEYPNLVVLRTFSKAFSLAGARAGYFIANEDIVDALYRVKSPFSLNSLTITVARVLLGHGDLVKRRVRVIIRERERLQKALGRLAYPSDANFLLVKLDAYDHLLSRGIVVRKLSGRLDGHLRVTVGTRLENDAFIEAVEDFIENETPMEPVRGD